MPTPNGSSPSALIQKGDWCGSEPICRHRKENRRRVSGDNADPRGMTKSVSEHEEIHCSFDRGQLNGDPGSRYDPGSRLPFDPGSLLRVTPFPGERAVVWVLAGSTQASGMTDSTTTLVWIAPPGAPRLDPVLCALDNLSITIPYPQQDVYMHTVEKT